MSRPLAVISGAGIAGLSAAWWIERAGWDAVVVERAADLRSNGYMMGLSGRGYDVARRMGILERLKATSFDIAENVYRDCKGRELLTLRYRDFMKDVDYLAVRRTDVVAALADLIAGASVELALDTQIAQVIEIDDRIDVTLSDGRTLRADLLIGADGVRSALRARLMGSDTTFTQTLGYRFAAYDVADSLNLGADFLSFAEPGHVTEYYALGEGRLAVLQVWRSAEQGPVSAAERYALLHDVSAGSHPMVQDVIRHAEAAGTIPLIDDLVMIDLPCWSKGRQLLLGDAAHCLSLVSGQGAAMALASSALLGEELLRRPVDQALREHERRLRPAIDRLQNRTRKTAAMFVPRTTLGFHFRNVMIRNMPRQMLRNYFRKSIVSEIAAAEA